MVVGSFGGIVFEAGRERVRSFDSLAHEAGARIGSTEIVGREPLTEFLGPDGESASLNLRLSADLGVDPGYERDRLQDLCRKGQASALVIGGKPFGGAGAKWLIEKLSESYSQVMPSGPRWIDIAVTFRRYAVVSSGTGARTAVGSPVISKAIGILRTSGVEPGSQMDLLYDLGDTAVGTGNKVSEVAQAYGDVKKAGKFGLADLQKSISQGIPVLGELAAQAGKSQAEMQAMIESGDCMFRQYDRAIRSLAGNYTRIGGTLARQEQRVSGILGRVPRMGR